MAVGVEVDKEVDSDEWKEKRGQEPNILADPTPTKLYRCTKLSPAHLADYLLLLILERRHVDFLISLIRRLSAPKPAMVGHFDRRRHDSR